MSVTPTYPGAYVQEVPTSVRTIVGVNTSIALFIGRTKLGELDKPKRCLSYGDFEREFSANCEYGDLPRQVRLFFANGGTDCYVLRIAKDSKSSSVTLKDESAGHSVLKVEAKSDGLIGDTIRLAISYSGSYPESTFNLEAFRAVQNSRGEKAKEGRELYTALTMHPDTARYAVDYVNQNSSLIKLTNLSSNSNPSGSGYSQSGRPIPIGKDTNRDEVFRNAIKALLGEGLDTNCFRVSVGDTSPVDVDLSSIDFTSDDLKTPAGVTANLATMIESLINDRLPSDSNVTVTFEDESGRAGWATESNNQTSHRKGS